MGFLEFQMIGSNQYVSINGFDSCLAAINCGVHHRSVLGPLLFSLYMNDLNQAIKFWKVHHFADDKSIVYELLY